MVNNQLGTNLKHELRRPRDSYAISTYPVYKFAFVMLDYSMDVSCKHIT
jgi:hypothetical protein